MISNIPHRGQMIYYDDDKMECYTITAYSVTDKTPMLNVAKSSDFIQQYIKGLPDYEVDFEIASKVELDPTMMKRIAKYNEEKDIENLQNKKEKLQEEIKQLEENKKKQENRLQSVKDFILEFFSTTYNSIDDFIESKNDYDYDDYE